MSKFIVLVFLVLSLHSSDSFEIESKKCDDESFKGAQGNELVCLNAIQLLDKKSKEKDKKLSSLYLATAYIYEAKEDWKNAAMYFEKSIALETSFSDLARINMGTLYYHGRGVIKNYTKSYELWKQVVKNGDWTGNATNNLDYLCSKHSWACK
jgi:TPR repeat protein